MLITTNITRFDILRARLALVLRPGYALYIFMIAATVFTYLDMPKVQLFNFLTIVNFCLVASAYFFIILSVNLFFTTLELWTMRAYKQGILGEHKISISEEGFEEVTEYNRTVHPWHIVEKPIQRFGLIMVRAGAGWHIFPRRIFSTRDSLNAFISSLLQHSQHKPNTSFK